MGRVDVIDFKQARIEQDYAYDRPLLRCRFSPAGDMVVSSSEDSSLQKWDISSGEKTVLKAHESWVQSLQFSNDGNQLVSGGCDGRLIWWSIREALPQPIRTVNAHQGWIRSLALSPDGSTLASVGNDLQIRLWNLSTGEMVDQWSGHEKHLYSVLFHPDGKHLFAGDLAGKLHMWELEGKQIARSFDAAPLHTYEGGQRVDFGGVRSIAMTPDQTQVLAAGLHKATNPLGAVHEPLVLRFKFADSQLVQSHVCDGIPGGVIWRVMSLSDGTTASVCGGSSGGFLLFFSADQEKDIHRFQLPALARDMDYHVATERIVTVHHDHHVRITNLNAKTEP